VEDAAALEALLPRLLERPEIPLWLVADDDGPLASKPVGLALGLGEGRAAYLAFGPALAFADVATALSSAFGAPGRVAWVACGAKRLQQVFAEHGVELALPHFDVEIAGQLVDPAAPHDLPALAARHAELELRPWTELAGRGAKARPASELERDELAPWAGAAALAIGRLHEPLARRLEADGSWALCEEVELPLTRVLARMERAGVRVDETVLERLSQHYESELARIEFEIYQLAGEKFLISSPKQLQYILFEKLKLPVVKKTKTGYSTDEDVMEQLASRHALPERVLAFRRLSKLKSTYVDALPPLVDPRTGRIHPTFHQLGAATGRMSATQPNVQNIPIRTEEGVRIREAFVAAEGCTLLSADYSQVELRILAHYSGDESLVEAFRRRADIHRETAAEVLGIAPEAVTNDQRARAKAINFGIVYGQSAFGLARQLGIAAGEARKMIDAYFERYRGVRQFLDATVEEARQRGYVRTYLGRRRYLPDLASRNRVLRSAAERMAVNSVIQGTAADLIKKAMVAVDAALEAGGSRARMILQVHDELVLEAPPGELERLRESVPEWMRGVLTLRVPLEVDVGVGPNWREAH
jgi:DNA polymerase-1